MRTSFLAFVVSASLLSGCTVTHALGPHSLVALDGFDASNPREEKRTLVDQEGERVEFTDDTPLSLVGADGHAMRATYRQIRVDDLEFVGTKRSGRKVTLDLGKVTNAEVEETSTGRTIAAAVGIPLAVAAVVGGVLVGVVAASFRLTPGWASSTHW